jgi:SAM-dependent methyltransferase
MAQNPAEDPDDRYRRERAVPVSGRRHASGGHIERLQAAVDRVTGNARGLRVLEAGCGARTRVRFGRAQYVVGIDISQSQLGRNHDLDERILGDVQTYPLPASSFDAVVCWNLLEHLDRPEQALANVAQAVKPGGLVLLALPNVLSIKGLVTKLTPYRFHVWVHRTLLRRRSSGQAASIGSFPTKLRLAIAPSHLRRFASQNGFSVEYATAREARQQVVIRRKLRLEGRAWRIAKGAVNAATVGRIETERTELILLLRRHPGVGTRATEASATRAAPPTATRVSPKQPPTLSP